jgi:hypothetical protein
MANMNKLILGMLTIVLGLALTPTINGFVAAAQANDSTNASLIGLVSIVWVFVVIGVAAALVYSAYRG